MRETFLPQRNKLLAWYRPFSTKILSPFWADFKASTKSSLVWTLNLASWRSKFMFDSRSPSDSWKYWCNAWKQAERYRNGSFHCGRASILDSQLKMADFKSLRPLWHLARSKWRSPRSALSLAASLRQSWNVGKIFYQKITYVNEMFAALGKKSQKCLMNRQISDWDENLKNSQLLSSNSNFKNFSATLFE